jgi:hypothetical protein
MEAVYLQNNIGKELASALAALHTYGLNSHTDPSQPLKDPIAFLGSYLLEKTRVEQEILASKAAREPVLAMLETMKETTKTYTSRRRATLTSLALELETRTAVKAEKLLKKIEEQEIAASVKKQEAELVVEKEEEEEEVVAQEEPEVEQVDQVDTGGRESVVQEETGGEENGENDGEQGEEVAE